MNIALLNTRITFQEQTASIDAIGNSKNEWRDVFSCYATLAGESGSEVFVAGGTTEKIDCTFTCRWSSEVAGITSLNNRIVCDGAVFDIQGVDHMSNKHKCVKFKCTRQERGGRD